MKDVIIVGSGPAGLTAAMYLARADRSVTVIAGQQLGGQVSMTWEIENYPGFHDPLTGADLVDRFVRHAERFGAEIAFDEVTGLDLADGRHKVIAYGGVHEARAVVVALGASPRHLDVPGEAKFAGRGVSYCATCDGAFFKGADVVVVGGGDSALEEALFLTRFASRVRIVHRRDALRAGTALQARARASDRIEFVWSSRVTAILGDDKVDRVQLEHVETGELSDLATAAVFVFIGHDPNSTLLRGQVALDAQGYAVVDDRMQTSVPGVFAAGEIMDPRWRQVATSVGQGCAAAIACEHFLAALD